MRMKAAQVVVSNFSTLRFRWEYVIVPGSNMREKVSSPLWHVGFSLQGGSSNTNGGP